MTTTLNISPRRWAAALGIAVLVVTSASVGASLLSFMTVNDPLLMHVRDTLVRLIWLDGEANVPAWFSGCLLFLAAVLLAAIAAAHRRSGGPVLPWRILALIFLFLSLDEIAQLHELSIRPLRDHFHTTGLLYYPWIVPAGICVSTLAIGYSDFLTALPGRTRWFFLGAGALYVLGAVGMEALSGQQAAVSGEQSPVYHVIVTLEELLEMTGVVVFIYALLDYLARRFTPLTLRFGGS